jgi:hopanoid biosynthesis associated RND transporter like protein HpnN
MLLAGLSVWVTIAKLQFQPNRNDLISPDLAWNQIFIDWQTNFPGSRDLTIVVDAGPGRVSTDTGNETWANEAIAKHFVAQLTPKLRSLPLVGKVTSTLDTADFTSKSIRLAPMPIFEQQLDQLKQTQPLLTSPTPEALLAASIRNLRQNASDDTQASVASTEQTVTQIQQFNQLVQAYHQVLSDENAKPAVTQLTQPSETQYLTSANSRLYFIRLTPLQEQEKLNALEGAINSIQNELTNQLNEPEYQQAGLQAGLTGIEVVEGEETAIATRDSTIATIIASLLIAILLMLAFHSVRGPLLAMISLFIGIAWSFGILTITIGHLQVISVVFTVILLGLGIDFAIHLKSSFENLRHDHDDTEEGFRNALVQTFRITGPGILTGAFTTAAAFMTTLLTDFTGVAEMGFIASIGVLLCLIVMFTVYPALLRLVKPGHEHFKPMENRKLHFFDTRWVIPFARHPWKTVIIAIGLTAISGYFAITHVRFDYDLLKLQPANAPAMNWAKRVITDGGESIYFGVSVCKDIDQARDRMAAFNKLDLVRPSFGGIGMLFPTGEQEKINALNTLKTQLGDALNPQTVAYQPATTEQIEQLKTQFQALQLAVNGATFFKMPDEIKAALTQTGQTILQVNKDLLQWPTDSMPQRVGLLRHWYHQLQIQIADQIRAVLDTSALTPDDVPQALLDAYRDAQGRWTLEVYPKLEQGQSPLAPEFLPNFVKQMKTVDPNITGVLMQIYQSGKLIRDAYVKAGALALMIVFVIVLIDFRNVHDTLLAMLPVAIGFSVTFAIMQLFGMQINPANIIVLPLMFGIGVDSGVHVLHRYRQHPEDDPPGLTQATGKGITITTMTTVIGFACMMLAEHRGIRSLGFVVSLGLTLTLLSCWTVMPAWLVLTQRIRTHSKATT